MRHAAPVSAFLPFARRLASAPSILLALCVASAAQDVARAVPPDARLDALVGVYDVAARIFAVSGAAPSEGAGEATLERSHGGTFVHERFSLSFPGRAIDGDAWFAWRAGAGRYELSQIDDGNPYTPWLLGRWDAARGRLVFDDLAEARPAGGPALRWEYRLSGDGGFVKELYRADGQGGWSLASDYRYSPKEIALERPRATHVEEATRVPMFGASGHVLIDVELNGRGPFRMLVDTGAATSVLDGDLAAELGIELRGKTRIGDPSDPLANEVDTLEIEAVRVGDAIFEGVPAVAWRGPSITAALGARGVLGLPTFRDCLLSIDYPRREVEVASGELPPVDGKSVLALDARAIAEVPVAVAGRAASAHLDAGNGSSLIVPGSWKDELATKGPLRTGRGMRASGPVEFTIATLDGDLRIGEHVLHDPEVRFDSGLEHVNVGYGLLRGFVVTLDQRNGRVQLELPPVTR